MNPKSEPTEKPSHKQRPACSLAADSRRREDRDIGAKTFRFEILRYDASTGEAPRFATYKLIAPGDISVLEALLHIRDQQDPTLAFRYSCRGAVCGSCAMSIGGKLQLACRVLLKNLPSERVVVEPMPGFEIIRDLVVDMEPFWAKYERVRPWLQATLTEADRVLWSERDRRRVDQYVNCILCGLCYSACPVARFNPDFTGPAALAKLYRFLADPRERRSGEELDAEDSHDGAWGCHTITRCIDVCPKNVRPTDGIEGVRRKLIARKLRKWFPFTQKL
jgi:succinate dehydrogenase/fumarate reductase iron-sulfur protein